MTDPATATLPDGAGGAPAVPATRSAPGGRVDRAHVIVPA